jgi:cytochrome c nitrite reductase small subunit
MLRPLRNATIGWLLSQAAMYGEESTTALFHTDPVEVWGSRFLITTICVGVALLLFTLFRYRGKTAGAVYWSLVVAGVALVPMVSTGLGTLLVFDRAERVEFCESCHLTMQKFVDDMKNPKSESLAAVHFKNKYIPDNQCYVCHTSYGMFGTVQAKMSGMVDVYKYFTRTYPKVISMREPYPNHDCLKCHADSAKWLSQDVHIAVKDDLFADKAKCLDCHGDEHPAHPDSVRHVAAR